ncbi:leucine-rich repeat domain-containing protein, partial [Listeria sp. FSL L7-0091]|uniref:leucine-rich repeat domain-containing protein n=1 Tax=Listeria farberi TaxID=2713500 RepID=UPI001623F5F8
LATEMNAADSQAIGASESGEEVPENVVEAEGEIKATEEEEIVSGETPSPKPQEEKESPVIKPNNGKTTANKEKKETTSKTERNWEEARPISEIFPDPNVAREVQRVLGKDSVDEEITQSDLDAIYDINFRDVRDATGIERLTNLAYLSIVGEDLYLDANVVAGMSSLEHLYVINCNMVDISPLAYLENLTALDISLNQISDLTSLANLTNLTYLRIAGNQISDLTPLAGLTQLIDLDVSNNQISDVSPLADLTNILYLEVSRNQISDISSLAEIARNMGDDPYSHIYAGEQEIRQPAINWSEVIKVPNIVTHVDGNLVAPEVVVDGRYEEAELVWEGLPNEYQELIYAWMMESYSPYISFSGEVRMDVEPIDEPG